ncbi:hypothetical protein J5N97_003533 [Dioscorea zingiberensis]|uniref:Uncharacterized protein n=1 Tax=Dioscorea zingiberensis TaxID=325984 RepID=A0A9D5D656_9LILI|nr:hypothetical protein J5N97_003533 [Dioscorea zingiberensis]
MGCSASRLEDEEAVQLCKDRRNFIKQAVDQRIRFAIGHIAYIDCLRRVSLALRNYVDGDERHDFFLDSYTTPPFTPVKRLSREISGIPLQSISPSLNQHEKSTVHVMRYLRSSGNQSVSVEEWPPQSPETVRIDSYYPVDHYGIDSFFTTQASPMHSSSQYNNRPSYPPPSPQNSQWDYFWNPFSSLDSYGYPSRYSLDHIISDDDVAGLRQVREEEGIPELEEDVDEESREPQAEVRDERTKVDIKPTQVAVETQEPSEKIKTERKHEVKEFTSQGTGSVEVSEPRNAVDLEVSNEQQVVESDGEAGEQTPGFTVFMNRRPTSMLEVMRDIESQFARICDSAHEISVMLEASRAQYSSTSTDHGVRMLNPVALFRSASSRSSSSRFLQVATTARDDGYESSSDYSEESCMMISGSHQSTLERLYAWEKKLYEEVKCGERIRIAYEKKCIQLRNQDVNGDEPAAVDRTRATIRDLHTRLKVSMHTVESVSRRIEKLRDEELHPQLLELIQGLARMWRLMADCHVIQKNAIEAAKTFLSSSASAAPKPFDPTMAVPARPSRAAAALESELRAWRSTLESWIHAQRSYARALAAWIRRCAGRPPPSSSPPPATTPAPPAYGLCVRWSRLLDSLSEAQVIDGLDFFAAGMASVSGGGGEEAAAMTVDIAGRVLWAGMSVAVGSLAEFASGSAEGYDALIKRCLDGSRDDDAEVAGPS